MRIACDQNQIYDFKPDSTALLSIDFQADFLAEDGFAAVRGLPIASLRRPLRPARSILDAARRKGLLVIHTRECYAPDLSDLNAFRRARDQVIGAPGPLGRFLLRGEGGTSIVGDVAPLPSELIVDKPGFNAFHKTDLDQILSQRGISHLILMGVTTQVCVASTLRGAVDCGYFPLLLSDCCAAWDERDHLATIKVVFSENHQFGWVSDSARTLLALG